MEPSEHVTPQELARYASMDEEELFAEIGAARLGDTLGMRPSEFGRYVRVGRRWFEERRNEFRKEICEDSRIRSLRASLESDTAVEAATIVDTLTTSTLGTVPVAVVAVVITKHGLSQFCDWQDDNDEGP